jgi:hypothetical protein
MSRPGCAHTILSAARNKVPTVYPDSVWARDGGLLSYGPDPVDIFRRSAAYVDRILRGAKPAELPVQDIALAASLRPAIFDLSQAVLVKLFGLRRFSRRGCVFCASTRIGRRHDRILPSEAFRARARHAQPGAQRLFCPSGYAAPPRAKHAPDSEPRVSTAYLRNRRPFVQRAEEVIE